MQILAEIEKLPPRSKQVMQLAFQGLDNQQIAQEINISVSSVKTLKYNALHTMRSRLEEKYYLLLWLFINKI